MSSRPATRARVLEVEAAKAVQRQAEEQAMSEEESYVWVAEYEVYGDYWVDAVYASEERAQADLEAGKFTRLTKFRIIV